MQSENLFIISLSFYNIYIPLARLVLERNRIATSVVLDFPTLFTTLAYPINKSIPDVSDDDWPSFENTDGIYPKNSCFNVPLSID